MIALRSKVLSALAPLQARFFKRIETKSSKCPSLLIDFELLLVAAATTKGDFE
jgi:hypothetical protein